MSQPRRVVVASAAFLTLAALAAADAGTGIAPWLTGALLPPQQADGRELLVEVQDFYQRRALRPAWTDGRGELTPAGRAAASVLARARTHGLPTERYAFDAPDPGERDVRLSWALLRYARDLQGGRWPRRESLVLWRRPPSAAGPEILEQLAGAPQSAERLAPRHAQYAALQAAHDRYARLVRDGGWAPLPPKLRAGAGARGPWLTAVVRRLAGEGDLRETGGTRLDGELSEALRRFQARHGIPTTGVIDAATVAAWNVPASTRLRQIEINLERWRWLPRDLGRQYLLVNVPTFELEAVRGGRRVLRMNVVTGAADTPTPVFSTQASSVVFRPWWNVPASIAEAELLPLARRSPGALARRGIVRAGNSLRQRPGPGNALGLVKVALDDTPGVYLHDTPQDALFARRSRAFSHGCVRLERPAELARLLLEGTEWDGARIQAAMARGPERVVRLAEPWPVHVVYFTVWVGDDGSVRFAPDVYGHDALQARVLWGEPAVGSRPAA